MDERVRAAIKEYYRDKLFAPGKNWPEYYFKQRSYSRWAAKEVLRRIRRNPRVTAIETVEDFIDEVVEYREISSAHWNKDDRLVFEAAYNVATDILDILIAMR